MIHIAVDAMGGDHAPHEVVTGAYLAAKHEPNLTIHLVGVSHILDQACPTPPSNVRIMPASETVSMDDAPMDAYKKKKDSSIHVGLQAVKDGSVDAFVSAGNTGAVMSCSLFILGRIPGVDRPALASLIPTKKGHALMLDMGSNVDSKPNHLAQYAMMGHFFSSQVLHVDQPRVGLINIGEEEEKGNQLTQQAYEQLKQLPLNFIGNVEGKDILFHQADVVVCDGFVGNTLLKFGEGVVDFMLGELKSGIVSGSYRSKLGGWLLKPVFRQLKKRLDYEEYGGAPLLGVNGVSIIAHGKSNAKAMVSAIRTAKEAVKTNMIHTISTALQTTTHDT